MEPRIVDAAIEAALLLRHDRNLSPPMVLDVWLKMQGKSLGFKKLLAGF